MESFDITSVYRDTPAGRRAPVSEEHPLNRSVRSGSPAVSRSIIFHDNIDKHSAPDSVIGTSLITITGFSETAFFVGGRVSSEILSMVLRCHMPVIAVSEVPANQEMERSMQTNGTPIARVDENRMSGYGRDLRIC